MTRTLKVSSRPFIVFGILFGAIELLILIDFIRARSDSGLIVPLLTTPFCYAVWLALIYSVRVKVSEQGITLASWFSSRKCISFADIDHSEIQILAERDWPVSITIYGAAKSEPLARIGLKAVQKSDAEWFCALPALKAVVHPGFTQARSNKSLERTRDR